MKTLVILAVLLITSTSFAQGVWREVATPNDSVRSIDFFSGGVGYINTLSTHVELGYRVTDDSIYHTQNYGKTWKFLYILGSDENGLYSTTTSNGNFYLPNKWYYTTNYYDKDEVVSTHSIFFLQNQNVDTSIKHLPYQVGGPFLQQIISGVFIANDTSIYIHYNDSIFVWDKDSSSWRALLSVDENLRYSRKLDINLRNHDLIIITDTATNIFPSLDTFKFRTAPLPPSFPPHHDFYPRIKVLHDSIYIYYSGKYYTRTTNFGVSWSSIDSLDATLKAYDFTDYGLGFFSTRSNTTSLYKTSDFGKTWQLQFSGEPDPIYDISIVDSDTIYFSNGKLFKTTDGGGSILLSAKEKNKQVSTEGISIYPNPVVRNTCQLRHPIELSDQPIIVHDMLGRRVQYIFPAVGTDITSLDLIQLPSGVYYVAMGNERLKLIKD